MQTIELKEGEIVTINAMVLVKRARRGGVVLVAADCLDEDGQDLRRYYQRIDREAEEDAG